ncbi:hypothetical protein ACFLTD_02830 [Elusimicrobiota bacterium]
MKSVKIIFLLLIVMHSISGISSAETVDHSLGVNPVGFLYQGLSYLEYERKIKPKIAVTVRLDNFRYEYEESETRYTYDETGNGYGVGVGVRQYVSSDDELEGFFIGSGAEALSVKWEWDEYDYGATYTGEGTTLSFAVHASAGYKFVFNEDYFFAPLLYIGWLYIESDELQATGVFFAPAVTIGVKLQ